MLIALLTLVVLTATALELPRLLAPGRRRERWTFLVLMALTYVLTVLHLLQVLPNPLLLVTG